MFRIPNKWLLINELHEKFIYLSTIYYHASVSIYYIVAKFFLKDHTFLKSSDFVVKE